jgi:hypothetical protein
MVFVRVSGDAPESVCNPIPMMVIGRVALEVEAGQGPMSEKDPPGSDGGRSKGAGSVTWEGHVFVVLSGSLPCSSSLVRPWVKDLVWCTHCIREEHGGR